MDRRKEPQRVKNEVGGDEGMLAGGSRHGKDLSGERRSVTGARAGPAESVVMAVRVRAPHSFDYVRFIPLQ